MPWVARAPLDNNDSIGTFYLILRGKSRPLPRGCGGVTTPPSKNPVGKSQNSPLKSKKIITFCILGT